MITKATFKGTDSIVLESGAVKVVILPEIGGKVASFYHKSKDFELLFQNKENFYRRPELYSPFECFDAAGFDDAFPSIDAGEVGIGDRSIQYPDHGEIWSMPFEYECYDARVELWCESKILPYTYRKVSDKLSPHSH